MPALEIDTNAPKEKITPALTLELTKMLAEMLDLDQKLLSVIFRPNPLMVWGGTAEPCALCRLTAINNVDEEHNKTYAAKIFKFMGDKFSIPGDRMYTVFTNPPSTHVGFTGKLFSEIMKK